MFIAWFSSSIPTVLPAMWLNGYPCRRAFFGIRGDAMLRLITKRLNEKECQLFAMLRPAASAGLMSASRRAVIAGAGVLACTEDQPAG
jgi:hypothetical protein